MAAGEDVGRGELWRLGASELARAFAQGAAAPDTYLDALLARVERINPRINAMVALSPQARADAADSAARIRDGQARSVLEGIPVAVKDNILVRGLPTTWGSPAFADAVSDDDEFPVRRLRDAGAVILGKTNCPEFTLEGYTANPLFGVTRNPWDVTRTPGGSSGGAVAGVAAGLFPLALGTDGGGSIRRPASHTGLVGVKPSIGAIARFPTLPQILLDFEVIGPIARSVADAALLFNAICGPDARDRSSLTASMREVRLHPPDTALHILCIPRFDDNPLDPEIAASVDDAARVLAGLGHRLEHGVLPFDLAPIVDFWPILGQVGVAHVFARNAGAETLAAQKFVEMAEIGRAVSAVRYLEGLEAVRAFRRAVTEAYERFDLIMTPTAAALPWPAEQTHPAKIAGRDVGPRGHAVYTGWVNACGHPAISLPCGPSRQGLPIGFQLVARYGEDELLFRVGAQYERVARFPTRWPALAYGSA